MSILPSLTHYDERKSKSRPDTQFNNSRDDATIMSALQRPIYAIWFMLALGCTLVLGGPARSDPLNTWTVSCGADPGSVEKHGNVRTFITSRNHCPGGIFHQRAEIASDPISPTQKGAYLFKTTVSMKTASTEKFGIFQIHDARLGCAPPLVIYVYPDGRLNLTSDIKTGPGESCIRGALNNRFSKSRLRRDGTPQELSVLVEFNGEGGFKATLFLDGKQQVSGWYDPSKQPAEFRSKKFYFKHGVYSQHMFDYVMTSTGMRVTKVVVK